MTAPPTGPAGQPEAAVVIVIDLRASAADPDAAVPGSIDEQTLEERQRRGHGGRPGGGPGYPGAGYPPEWRLINFERLLVIDDAAAFARHEDDYRHLIEAPTFGRMLCLVIGAPASAPYLDLPAAVDAARAPVLWVGDSRGVGWRLGWASTTRLAFSDTDPDGAVTVANLIESLTSPGVFDEMARAISGLPGRTGVPALLPWARWPSCDRNAAEQDRQPGNGKRQDGAPDTATMDAAPGSPGDHGASGRRWLWRWRWRRSMPWLLLALCCAIIAIATVVATIRLGRGNAAYDVAGAGCAAAVLLVLLAIARRIRARSTLTRPVPVPAPSAPPEPPDAELPLSAAPPSPEVLARARWMMSVPVADEAFRQLSAPEQLVMLGGDQELARLVRFAPASARTLIEHAIDADSVSWTPEGDQLGVVRLVPLKAGLVRQRGA